jgi:hypothetical protein
MWNTRLQKERKATEQLAEKHTSVKRQSRRLSMLEGLRSKPESGKRFSLSITLLNTNCKGKLFEF